MARATLSPPPGYEPAGGLGRALLGLLGFNAALAWVEIVGIYTFLERVWRGLAGRFMGPDTLEAHWGELETARRIHGLVWLVTAIVFLVWIHRTYRNLPVLGATDLAFTPRAAVSAFLVPVLNVIVPVRVVRELWNGSDPTQREPSSVAPGAPPTSPWVIWWWGVFLAAVLLDPVVFRIAGNLEARLTVGSTALLVLAQFLEMAAAILGMVVVWSVNQGQQEIFESQESG